MKNIDLSIIVPIYNVEDYLEECLNSVYPLSISKEIILVNDGSTDNSLKIAEKYKNLYPNQTLLFSQENKGLSGARNTGLKNASGEYIYFLDSDDFIDTQKFEEFFNEIKIEDDEVDIIHSHIYYNYINKENFSLNKEFKPINIKLVGYEFLTDFSLKNKNIPAVWLNIYKKDFFIKNNLKFQETLLYEDTHFSYFASLKARKIKIKNIVFYNYRQREGSIMSKPINYNHILYIINDFLDYNKKNNINYSKLWILLFGIMRDIVKRGKVYNFKIYKKLFFMKGKNLKSYYKLIQLLFKFLNAKNISYNDIINVIKNK